MSVCDAYGCVRFMAFWTNNRLTNTLECFSCAGTAKAFRTLFFLRANMCVDRCCVHSSNTMAFVYGYKVSNMKLNGKMCMSNQCFYSVSASYVSLLPSRYVLRIYLALFLILYCV